MQLYVTRRKWKWKKRRKGRWKIYDESHISTRSAKALKIYDHHLTDWPDAEDTVPSWLTEWLNDKLLNIMSLIGVINEVYVNILIFLYSWTDNARSIPQMYNFICIWWIRPKLLTHSKFVLGEIKWMYDNNICIPLLYKTHH